MKRMIDRSNCDKRSDCFPITEHSSLNDFESVIVVWIFSVNWIGNDRISSIAGC